MIFRGQIRLHQGSMLNHVLVIIVIERLTRKMKSRCPNELPYVDDLALVSGSLEVLNVELEAWKGILESKALRKYLYDSEN